MPSGEKLGNMIQLKTPYTHIERAIPITGTLRIEIASWQVLKDATIYQIEDFIVDENGAKRLIIQSKSLLELLVLKLVKGLSTNLKVVVKS